MPRTLLCLLLATGCVGGDDKDPDTTGDTSGSEACALAADSQTCPECSDGTVTCTFDDTSATAASCGGCQARAELYGQLCADGETADRATIEANTVCAPAACVVLYDPCNDPCTPRCLDEGAAAELNTACDLDCSMPSPEPGSCENTGFACEWVKE